MQKTFLTGRQSDTDFNYISLKILQKEDCIEISQKDYINSTELVEIPIKPQYQFNKEEKHKLGSMIGQINWVTTKMQPDIGFSVLDLSISMNKTSTILDLLNALKLLKKVTVNKGTLKYPNFSPISNPTIFVYIDVVYVNLCNGVSSVSGHVIFFQNNIKNCILSCSLTKIK